jgi:ABC-type Fe3+-hydroxamate transport system substrate-binding protein
MQLIDQIKHQITINDVPKKIISLVPSQTEFLFDIGLDDCIVGITKFCIHPKDKIKDIINIGGTKNCRLDKIESLNPDIIIANKEENTQSDIEYLQKKYTVYTSDIKTLEDNYQMMSDIGTIFNKQNEANKIIEQIKSGIASIDSSSKKKALYFIWRKPWMSIGHDTFINEMMHQLGFENIVAEKTRYPELSIEEIQNLQAPYILLSSEPFPFKQRHIDELQELCPMSKIIMVDGEIFSWYGSRLQHASTYFHKELVPLL